jgi:hypothetical protein
VSDSSCHLPRYPAAFDMHLIPVRDNNRLMFDEQDEELFNRFLTGLLARNRRLTYHFA